MIRINSGTDFFFKWGFVGFGECFFGFVVVNIGACTSTIGFCSQLKSNVLGAGFGARFEVVM